MIDLNEINRDPWPTFPVNKDDLRSLLAENARMRDIIENLIVSGVEHRDDFRIPLVEWESNIELFTSATKANTQP